MKRGARPQVSVVMTTFNHQKFLRESIDSVLKQSLEDLELIVVDDGTGPDFEAVVRGVDDARLHAVAQPNAGPSAALNRGLGLARGDEIALMSGDDLMLPGRLQLQSQVLEGRQNLLLFSLADIIGEDGEALPDDAYPKFTQDVSQLSTAELTRRLFYRGNFLCAPAAYFSKALAERIGGFNVGYWQLQDFDYWIRALAAGADIQVLARRTVAYRRRALHANLSSPRNAGRAELEQDLIFRDFLSSLPETRFADAFRAEQFFHLKDRVLERRLNTLVCHLKHSDPKTWRQGYLMALTLLQTVDPGLLATVGLTPRILFELPIPQSSRSGSEVIEPAPSQSASAPGAALVATPVTSQEVRSGRIVLAAKSAPVPAAPAIVLETLRPRVIVFGADNPTQLDETLAALNDQGADRLGDVVILARKPKPTVAAVISAWSDRFPIQLFQAEDLAASIDAAVEGAASYPVLLIASGVGLSGEAIGGMVSALRAGASVAGVRHTLDSASRGEAHSLLGYDWVWNLARTEVHIAPVIGELEHEIAATAAVVPTVLMLSAPPGAGLGAALTKPTIADASLAIATLFLGAEMVITRNATAVVNGWRWPVGWLEARSAPLAVARAWVAALPKPHALSRIKPFTLGLAVRTGDWERADASLYAATWLGEAVQAVFGWRILVLPREAWEDGSDLDAIIFLHPDRRPSTLRNTNPHLMVLGWVIDDVERWVDAGLADEFDLILCGSKRVERFIRENSNSPALHFPLATPVVRASPQVASDDPAYAFAGHFRPTGKPRKLDVWDPKRIDFRFRLYGRKWKAHPRLSAYAGGAIEPRRLSRRLASIPVLLDEVSKPGWGIVSGRTFEALASGSLVLSNQKLGAEELFSGELPIWSSIDDLPALLTTYLTDEARRAKLVANLRNRVLHEHTYEVRARHLQHAIGSWMAAPTIILVVPSRLQPMLVRLQLVERLTTLLRAQGASVRVELRGGAREWAREAIDAVIVFDDFSAVRRTDRVKLVGCLLSGNMGERPGLDELDVLVDGGDFVSHETVVSAERLAVNLATAALAPKR